LSRVEQAIAALATLPAIEWVAAALALGYLLLAIRQSPWCWAFSVASALLYLAVFMRADLYMQAALQVFYVGMAVYGWRTWRGVSPSTTPLRSRPAASTATYSKAPMDQSSRVTLRTSSMVVTPDSTLARPSSRMPGVRMRA